MNYQTFKQEWLGRRVDYDHVYYFQCVDLILEYLKECFGLASGVWGNAIDYWNRPTAALLTKFDKVSTTDVQQGDIVVLNGLSGNPYGHIMIATGAQDGSTFEGLEQNGYNGSGDGLGGNAIRTRSVIKSRIAGVLRPKSVVVPAPAPVAASSTVFLPSSAGPWHFYYYGTSYNPNDPRSVRAVLRPDNYPPGLTYKIEGWVGDSAVIITTQMFGRGVIWVKGTPAVIN